MNASKGQIDGNSIMIIFSQVPLKLIREFNILSASNNVASSKSARCANDAKSTRQFPRALKALVQGSYIINTL
jgi:hypothetical protein